MGRNNGVGILCLNWPFCQQQNNKDSRPLYPFFIAPLLFATGHTQFVKHSTIIQRLRAAWILARVTRLVFNNKLSGDSGARTISHQALPVMKPAFREQHHCLALGLPWDSGKRRQRIVPHDVAPKH